MIFAKSIYGPVFSVTWNVLYSATTKSVIFSSGIQFVFENATTKLTVLLL